MLVLLAGLAACWAPPEAAAQPEGQSVDPYGSDGSFLYEEGSIHDIAIDVDEHWLHALDQLHGTETYGTVTYGGQKWLVGIRLKGSSTFRHIHGKPSFKLDFGQWLKHQTFHGVRKLTLNAMVFDKTMLREHAAYELFHEMAVPAPRHGYARVTFNGEDYGLYGIVESLDKQFVARNFPGNEAGNLYDTTFNFADLDGAGEAYFDLQLGQPSDDLHQLIADVGHAGGDILSVIERRFDADELFSMLAVDLVSPNWDGYSHNKNNYLLYHALPADRWYMIPWGQDQAFVGGGSVYAGLLGHLATACVNQSACKERLDAKIRDLLDVWQTTDFPGFVKTAADTIRADCEADPKAEQGCDVDKIMRDLDGRPEMVLKSL